MPSELSQPFRPLTKSNRAHRYYMQKDIKKTFLTRPKMTDNLLTVNEGRWYNKLMKNFKWKDYPL